MCSLPVETRAYVRSSGNGDKDDCEPIYGCWKSTLCSLEGQPLLFIADQSLKPMVSYFKKNELNVSTMSID